MPSTVVSNFCVVRHCNSSRASIFRPVGIDLQQASQASRDNSLARCVLHRVLHRCC